jgi:hypothetical protein
MCLIQELKEACPYQMLLFYLIFFLDRDWNFESNRFSFIIFGALYREMNFPNWNFNLNRNRKEKGFLWILRWLGRIPMQPCMYSGWVKLGQWPTVTGLTHGARLQCGQSAFCHGSGARCVDSATKVAWPATSEQRKTREWVSMESFYVFPRVRPTRYGAPDRT